MVEAKIHGKCYLDGSTTKENARRRFMTRNIEITILGIAGWFLSNVPNWFEGITGIIAVCSSGLGLIMLFISIRTGIVNYRLKKIEYTEKKINHIKWMDDENSSDPTNNPN